MHPQAFLRLVDQLSGFDLVWLRGNGAAPRPRGGPVPIYVELSPRGKAMLETLRAMDRAVGKRRGELGVKASGLLTSPA